VAVKKLKGPIAMPMFTTNPNQHTVAHLLAWLPLHNKRKERSTKRIRRKQRKKREKSEEEDTNWHPIGNVEEVSAPIDQKNYANNLSNGKRKQKR
jgi:hypothetical protein